MAGASIRIDEKEIELPTLDNHDRPLSGVNAILTEAIANLAEIFKQQLLDTDHHIRFGYQQARILMAANRRNETVRNSLDMLALLQNGHLLNLP